MLKRTLALLSLLAASPIAAHAQKTGDQARLVFTLFGGYVGGQDLWTVGAQPIVDNQFTDILQLSRKFEPSWTGGLSATYYKGANIGIMGELQVIDSRLRTSCSILTESGSTINDDICASINGQMRSSLATAFTLGAVFRVGSRGKISPYFRAQGGLYVLGMSTTSVTGSYIQPEGPTQVDLYPEEGTSHVSGQFTLGAGVTIPIAKAYHLRLEGRGITYGVPVVTGPTEAQFQFPPTETAWNTQFQVLVGIDLVLERKRGRRY